MIAGLTDSVMLPAPSDDCGPFTTNCCNALVLVRFCGLTALRPVMVNTSPPFSRCAAAAVQPLVIRLVDAAQPAVMPWLDPFTTGEPPSTPYVCNWTFWSRLNLKPNALPM